MIHVRTAIQRKFTRSSLPDIQVRILNPNGLRQASTIAHESSDLANRIKNVFYGTTFLLGSTLLYFYITDTRAGAHRWIAVPILRTIYRDPEEAHEAGNSALKILWQFGLYPRERGDPDGQCDLQIEVFGHTLTNPIGTSAGIDKHADIPDALFSIGPSVVEIGGVTPMPQSGNDRPRVFRVSSQNAIINRYGLNSEGADHMAMRLRRRVREFAYSKGLGHDAIAERFVLDGHAGVPPGSLTPGKLLAVNLAKNKTTPEDDVQRVTDDYVYCVDRIAPYADILVVNVSSPNTPGLRTLQESGPLTKILTGVVEAVKRTDRVAKPSVMVKVSPDEDSDDQIIGICQAVWDSGIDGVIIGNTTNRRPAPLPTLKPLSPTEEQILFEKGGFSGPHLFEQTVALTKRYRKLLNERLESGTRSYPTAPNPPEDHPETASAIKAVSQYSGGSSTVRDHPAPVQQSIDTGVIATRNPSDKAESEKQPLFTVPGERFYDQPVQERDSIHLKPPALEKPPTSAEASNRLPPLPQREDPKVIFATGGITNGKQALEVIRAGASVAMVYTALVYGGVGTISRIKDEMRAEMKDANDMGKLDRAQTA